MRRLTGWQRLWIVLSVAWLTIVTWGYSQNGLLAPSYYYIEEDWLDESLQVIIDDAAPQLNDESDKLSRLKRVINEKHGDVKRWVEDAAETNQSDNLQAKSKLKRLLRNREAEKAKLRDDHQIEFAKVAFTPPFVLLALGFSVAWIRQGFQKK